MMPVKSACHARPYWKVGRLKKPNPTTATAAAAEAEVVQAAVDAPVETATAIAATVVDLADKAAS
jgi:hypothetical protein